MTMAAIVPIVGELVSLTMQIVDTINRSSEVDPIDKLKLIEMIKNAQDKVEYWPKREANS